MFNNSGAKRNGFLIATLVAVLLAALVGYLLMHRLQTSSVQSLQQSIEAWRVTLVLLRWAVIAMVAFGWNFGVKRLAAAGKISSVQAAQLRVVRWRVATWLLILELMLGQGMAAKFLGLISGLMI